MVGWSLAWRIERPIQKRADRKKIGLLKSLVTQFFFIFNLLTDRLHKNGSPQIRHSKDQPTKALWYLPAANGAGHYPWAGYTDRNNGNVRIAWDFFQGNRVNGSIFLRLWKTDRPTEIHYCGAIRSRDMAQSGGALKNQMLEVYLIFGQAYVATIGRKTKQLVSCPWPYAALVLIIWLSE